MTKEELIDKLKQIAKDYDVEAAHIYADQALLEYINDENVTSTFENIDKWYA